MPSPLLQLIYIKLCIAHQASAISSRIETRFCHRKRFVVMSRVATVRAVFFVCWIICKSLVNRFKDPDAKEKGQMGNCATYEEHKLGRTVLLL